MARLACAFHGLSPLRTEPGRTFRHTWPHRALLESFIDNDYALRYKEVRYLGTAAMASHPKINYSKASDQLGKLCEGILASLPNLTRGVPPKRFVNRDREAFVERAKRLRAELGET
jgi:hypothetical protein